MSKEQRRDYGSGSIYRRKSDGRWFGSYYAGYTETGTPRRPTVSASTEAAVKVKLRKKMRDLEDGGGSDVSARTNVKAWADEWLRIVEHTLAPKTYSSHASSVRKWIVPTIGHRRFDQLAPADVRKVADVQRAAGIASSSRLRTHSVLMTLLKAALQEGYPVSARVLAVKAPSKGTNDRTDLPLPAAAEMLAVAAATPWGSRWVAALLQGMRQGESLGLTWPEVDLERRILTISWQLQALPYRIKRDRSSGFRVPDDHEARQVRGRWHLVRPKSEAGWRVIPLVPWMVAALEAWREVAPKTPHGIVWYHPVGDSFKLDDAEWYALQDAVGVRHPTRLAEDDDGALAPAHYTIHEARHTTATLLRELEVDPTIVIAILGHTTIATSRGYQHTRDEHLRPVLEKMAERLALH